MDRSAQLEKNLHHIRGRIARACDRVGRDPSEVILVAVTKAVDPEVAGLLLDAGVKHIGENRIHEAERKQRVLGPRGVWHMIGHLQSRKVADALATFDTIHSVDRRKLAKRLNRLAERDKIGQPMPILLHIVMVSNRRWMK